MFYQDDFVLHQTHCEDGAYFIASIPSETTTQISFAMWKLFNKGNEWHHVALNALEKTNLYCLFAFRNVWVKRSNSQKSSRISFRCSGSCTFTGCPVEFKIEIIYFEINNPPETL